MSDDAVRERQKQYVRLWEENGPFLDKLRDQEIRAADTAASIRMFEQAFRIALRDLPLRESSGLLEWQDWMRRWRQRG